MRLSAALAVALGLLALGGFWAAGGFAELGHWALMQGRSLQNAMAGTLHALRAGEPGAFWGLMALAFGYGFAHAVGPGHGKVLIGGAALGGGWGAARMAGLALASSLAQSATAIALVYGGLGFVSMGARQMTELADRVLEPASLLAIAGVGGLLLWRGARGLMPAANRVHAHAHGHGPDCGCGHAHGPTPEQAARATTLRDAALLVGSIAIRPCTGAIFLLVIAWQFGLHLAGLAAVVAMGLGTASVTVLVALGAVGMRQGTLGALPGAARLGHVLQAVAGAAVMGLSAGMLAAL